MSFADLHLHTRFSDGTYGPAEVVFHARRQQLAALALTDHDTVEGCAATAAACAGAGLEFIAGTELTAEQDGDEIHILGYCVDVRESALLRELAKFQAVRQERIREMVARLNRLKVPLTAEAVFALANCRAPWPAPRGPRPHQGGPLCEPG